MGLTQGQLGELVGMDAPAISRIERGHRNLSFAQLSKLASALGLELYVGPPRSNQGATANRAATELVDVITQVSDELGRLQAKAHELARRYQDDAVETLRSDTEEIRIETERRLSGLLPDRPERRRK